MNTICHIRTVMTPSLTKTTLTLVPELFWYKLNNDISNYRTNLPVVDASSNGVATYVISRLSSQNCYSFSGGVTSNWVNIPSFTRSPIMTFSGWINMATVAAYSRIFDFGSTFRLHIMSATRMVFNDLNSVTFTTGFQNTWKHILFTVNGLTLTFYENGVVKLVKTMTIPVPADNLRGYLAKSYGADPNPICKYSDFRLYSRVLSSNEILTLYNT